MLLGVDETSSGSGYGLPIVPRLDRKLDLNKVSGPFVPLSNRSLIGFQIVASRK